MSGAGGETKLLGRWYFGGVASAMAACCTHPLDLIKVHLQTQQDASMRMSTMAVRVVKADGALALYNGLSASVLRQLTYSMTRFAIYETVKNQYLMQEGQANIPFYQKVLLAAGAGFAGGIVGTPADMVNVRMQNDMKIPPEQRRNYKHALDGLYRVYKHEGIKGSFSGASMASSRAIFMTIGQISMYDQVKQVLMAKLPTVFPDSLVTHFTASFIAAGMATFMTQPLDVMKTRVMNAPPGHYKTILSCAVDIGKAGPLGFFKGFIPAFIRLGPQTVLTFVFFEQLRLNFGYAVKA